MSKLLVIKNICPEFMNVDQANLPIKFASN